MNKVGYQSAWEMTPAFHTKTKTKTAPSKMKAAAVPPKAARPRRAGGVAELHVAVQGRAATE